MINWDSSDLQLLFLENTVKRMKYKLPVWKKIFPNGIPDKEIVNRIGQELIKINKKKKCKKCGKDLNRYLTKDLHMAGKHMKGCSTSSDIWKTQIKTRMRYHYIPIRTTKI